MVIGEPKEETGLIRIDIQNRFLHTNLEEIKIEWKLGHEKGIEQGCGLAPFQTGSMILPIKYIKGESLQLMFIDCYGNCVQEEQYILGGENYELPQVDAGCPIIQETEREYQVMGDYYSIFFSKKTGLIVSATYKNIMVLTGGPCLHLTGLDLGQWNLEHMNVKKESSFAVVELRGAYDKVKVIFTIKIDKMGMMKTTYLIEDMPYDSPRRVAQTSSICEQSGGYDEVGIIFQVEEGLDTFRWKRQGLWNYYPEWHMSPLEGVEKRFVELEHNQEILEPDREWKMDVKDTAVYSQYDICDRGTRAFSSMKANIICADLENQEAAFYVYSNGKDSLRMKALPKKERLILDTNPGIRYEGNWSTQKTNHSLMGTETYSGNRGDFCEIPFYGRGIAWFSSLDTICGTANIYVDGQLMVREMDLGISNAGKNARNYAKYYQRLVYSISDLSMDHHVLKIEVTGHSAKESCNCYVNIDYFIVLDNEFLGDTAVIINQEYNYTRISWGVWEKEPVVVQSGYTGTVYTKIGEKCG